MANEKNRDDEKLHWLIIGILFTGALLAVDFFYSSFGEMGTLAKVLLGIGHAGLIVLWLTVMAKFNDPNYDVYRKYIVGIATALALIIAIHHASSVEDKAVIDDANANKETSAP